MNLSLNQFMAEKEPEEDPDRLIYAYTSHISVPKWEDKNAKNAPKDCNHCSVKFSSGRVHNCRLCGQLFCSQCTEKYYLPYIFEKKDKQGPTRICVTCRDKCLIERIKEIYEKEKVQSKIKIKTAEKEKIEKDKGLWGYLLPFIQFNLSGDRREVEIEPPAEWDDINFFSNCKKCNKKGGKAHNCRTCGKLFCEKCTSKMNIPQFFDKKGKSGPARVCDNCRYLIVGGAKLVEKSSAAPLLPPLNDDNSLTPRGGEESPNHRRPPSVNLLTPRLCTVAGCGQSRVTKNGYCAAHANEHTAGGGSGNDIQINKEFLMNITWEGERDPIGKIVVADDSTTLLTIDNYFRKQPFAINIDHFQYIYRGEPIPEAFYEIFLGKHFGKNIFIRKKLSKAFFQQAGINDDDDPPPPMPPGDDDDSHPNGVVAPVKAVNNPFKRAETDKLEAEKKKKEEEEEKKKKEVGAFKRPQFGMSFKSPALSLANAPPPSDKPPVPPSAAINVPIIPENEDPFKARAKLLFGAK